MHEWCFEVSCVSDILCRMMDEMMGGGRELGRGGGGIKEMLVSAGAGYWPLAVYV